MPKGNVLEIARAAGLLGIKQTANLIPDCHPMPIEYTKIDYELNKQEIEIWSKESDWKTYTGSSDKLNIDIAIHGKDKFLFKILRFCKNKYELGYYEAKLQFDKDVLISEDYYNGIINCRIGKPPKDFRNTDIM